MFLEHKKFLKSRPDFAPKYKCNYLAMHWIRQPASNAHLAVPVPLNFCHPFCDAQKVVSGANVLGNESNSSVERGEEPC